MLPAFSRPITSERVKAVACVAMARAALDVVRERGGGSLDAAALGVLQSAIHWARRAVSIDPRLGEAYWTLALACDLSARAQSGTAPAQAEADRKECRDALSAIPSNSPRVPQARAMLTQRRKGREERPD